MFELLERDGLARICRLETPHGTTMTPTLLPVINPNQITISPSEMASMFGVRALMTNSYIILKSQELRERAEKEGVHSLLGFDGAIMTDSGTFQSHVYGNVDVEPLDIIKFQRAIGSDIGTVLDIFSEPDDSRKKAEEDLAETVARTGASVLRKGDMLLAGPVQGGRFPDLRTRAARQMSALDCDLHPLGGVVPLMESQRYSVLVDVVMSCKVGLDPSRPVHLFGCGHPLLFSLAVLMGCDTFDSSAYAKYAREGRMMFSDGTRFLEELRELPCHCPICSSHTAQELQQDSHVEKKLALHNLYVSFAELKTIRQAIHEGRLWELAETRCRSHPNLLDALKAMRKHTEFLEAHEPLSRELAYLYTSPESYHRPVVTRFRKRVLERFEPRSDRVAVLLHEASKPYSRTYADVVRMSSGRASLWVDSLFCPVPIQLDEMYPVAQSVVPEVLCTSVRKAKLETLEHFRERGMFPRGLTPWEGKATVQGLEKGDEFDFDLQRVRAVADMQFGRGAGNALLGGNVELRKSRKRGKVRNVLVDGEHILSMRAGDGLFTLKPDGARRLMSAFGSPKLRVIVNPDSAEFNARGKSVFCGFVLDADPGIVPGDEVVVVNEKDELIAVGRSAMTRGEILAFKKGVAVRVREGVESSSAPR
jgi:7-cyano-7-deazaguanine tRNA-ribosyltransferase